LKSPNSNLESFKRTPRDVEVVSPKIGIGKKSYEITKPSVESENGQTGIIRPNTPKKNVFYSDYLKDYNPKSIDFKSPKAGALKKEIIERTARSYNSISFVNPLSSRQINKLDKSRNSILDDKTLHSHRLEQIETPKPTIRARTSHIKEVKASPERSVENKKLINDDPERRVRDMKKDDLRNRMSKLSEQFFSPIKAPVITDPRAFTTEETSLSIDFKENKLFKKDYLAPQRLDFFLGSWVNIILEIVLKGYLIGILQLKMKLK